MMSRIMQPRKPLTYLRKLFFNGLILHNTAKSPRVIVKNPTLIGNNGEVHRVHAAHTVRNDTSYNITPHTLATVNVAPYPIFWLRSIQHNTGHYIFRTPDDLIHDLAYQCHNLTYKGNLVTHMDFEGFETEDTFIKWQSMNYCTYRMSTGSEWIQFAIRHCPALGDRSTNMLLYQGTDTLLASPDPVLSLNARSAQGESDIYRDWLRPPEIIIRV